MAIDFKKEKISGRSPEFWRGEAKVLPGGFKPTEDFPLGTVVRRATPLFVDFEARTAAVCKSALVLDGGTTTKPRVAKGHYFAVGDRVTKSGDCALSPTISAIDRTNPAYDVITLSAAYTGLAKDNILMESTEATTGDNAKKAEPLHVPNMVESADYEFTGKGLPTLDAAYDVVILYKNVPYPLPAEWLAGNFLKANPNIMFITQ